MQIKKFKGGGDFTRLEECSREFTDMDNAVVGFTDLRNWQLSLSAHYEVLKRGDRLSV
jgi:Fe-S-cluster formation regulator IscX/YfhJ